MMTGIVSLLGWQSLVAQEGADDKARRVADQIESGNFVVEINRALPMGGRSVNLTSLYSIEIKGDSVYSHLPYYGRAYSLPYGGGEGLLFRKPLTDYQVTYDNKDKATITFNCRSDDDNYGFSLQIFPNGSATLFVQPVNRQSISYHGSLSLEEEK